MTVEDISNTLMAAAYLNPQPPSNEDSRSSGTPTSSPESQDSRTRPDSFFLPLVSFISPGCSSLFRESLYLYGLIYEMLRNDLNSTVLVGTKSGKDVMDFMIQRNIHTNRPIFVLDECLAINEESMKKVRFVRNCFRSIGLGLVILGTDSRGAKLPSSIGNSSRGDFLRPWCFVVGRLTVVELSNDDPCTFRGHSQTRMSLHMVPHYMILRHSQTRLLY